MTARISLACNGLIGEFQYQCRQAIFVGEPISGQEARYSAKVDFDWSSALIDGVVLDFCPACTTRRQCRR